MSAGVRLPRRAGALASGSSPPSLPRRAGALVPDLEAHAPDRSDTQALDAEHAEQTQVPDGPRSPSPTPSEFAAPAARRARLDPADPAARGARSVPVDPPPAGARHHPHDLYTHPTTSTPTPWTFAHVVASFGHGH
ncbi:hypothetical protein [Streptomyces chartreusis]|uniref:hypothetical protein n=1 Tax=Streptomyces chartreusis TaxID=1969 RepID=UPI002E17DD76